MSRLTGYIAGWLCALSSQVIELFVQLIHNVWGLPGGRGPVQITIHCYNNFSGFLLCLLYTIDCYLSQVDQMLRGAPVDSDGNFDYVAFTRILKHGTKDE